MKLKIRGFAILSVAVALVLAVLSMPGVIPQRAQAQSQATQAAAPNGNLAARKITVLGSGSVYTAPDIAYVYIGVDIQNADLAAAMKEAETKMNAVLTALKTAGVAENDIQTMTYNIRRDDMFGQPPGGQSPQQPNYHVLNLVRATIRTVGKVGDTINAAVNAGANLVNTIEFSVNDPGTVETAARKNALEDARERATELATGIGGKLGQVVSVEEASSFGPLSGGAFDAAGQGGGGAPPISGGAFQVTVRLIVTFEVQ
jgi:uncharacterized protein